ncbi:MAG TPA: NUDIX hydrolase [Candidatus Paceibacterota bacterium]|nr:NUDIX hydrolase [Candidatus Paceibacterota bacterium]
MIPAPGAGSESTKKKRRRRRPANRSPQSPDLKNEPALPLKPATNPAHHRPAKGDSRTASTHTKRIDEVSAGGLVIDSSGTQGLLIGRIDQKDNARVRLLWSLPKGHIEAGETPEQAALREVMEETGIESEISRALGIIDFWFMAGGKRIHKTVHHYLFRELGGILAPQVTEVDEVSWFPLHEIIDRLAYPDEKKLIARNGDLPK